ncbi:subtilisin-like protease SBT3.9 [Phragmites australis]|uniref:subtilisin-like protease SBT3.9 n=1 Tax=Phragmites australis TaxID=29695 RepID=UPI002D7A0D0B|nr:subtilisin-like protease SBT3.9 [Phragmites australis]
MDLRSASCFALLLALVLVLPLSANASSKLYIVYMGEKKHDDPSVVTASHHDVLASVLGSKDEALKSIVYSYKHGFSGFAAILTESQAKTIASLPGVISVKANTHYKTHTTRSWDFLGIDYYQSSSSDLLKKAKYGEDVIVGVVDSGIWPESRSFEDSGYGPLPARWRGICQNGTAFNATSCNRKIIGARWYTGGVDPDDLKGEYMSARDQNGHGTHVASTIAGGQVRNVSFGGLASGVARGGAPRARLAVYKACWGTDSCGSAAVLAAIDDAINDGVDVLSLSLSSSEEIPGTLHAVARGITVLLAAGNDGPAAQTVRNAVPWVLTVAASTIDRSFPTVMSLGNNEKLVGQSLYYNATVNTSDFHALISADSCDEKSLTSTNVTGMVVLCSAPRAASSWPPGQRFIDAATRVFKAGAKGLIFAQHNSNLLETNTFCAGSMPCVLVDFEIAHRIASYANSAETPVVRISQAVSVVGSGVLSPRVAAFSSRGPSPVFPAIMKPDVAAPGVSILAAKGNSYVLMSGTSMACPHVSAVVALLKSVHPDWSPAMIKSAIVTTASVTDRFGMPIQAEGVPRKLADPFDFGGGHMNPDKAADPGLVYDVDAREYTRFFNCTLGPKDHCETYVGQLYQLNLPSIVVPDLKGSVTVWRTVTNVGPVGVTYRGVVEAPAGVDVSVEPSVIRFSGGGSKKATFRVTITARQRVQGGYTFGSLTWLDGSTHSVRIPVAVRTVIQDFVADTS